jgi:hypothetical protein
MTLLALVAGCESIFSARAAEVSDADEASIVSCQFVGEVQGLSGWGNPATSTGMENARNEARKKAAKLGATDIVWKPTLASSSPYANGLAYVCHPTSR